MKLDVKQKGSSHYIVNGMVVQAKNFKAALAEYLSVHGGSRPMFATKV